MILNSIKWSYSRTKRNMLRNWMKLSRRRNSHPLLASATCRWLKDLRSTTNSRRASIASWYARTCLGVVSRLRKSTSLSITICRLSLTSTCTVSAEQAVMVQKDWRFPSFLLRKIRRSSMKSKRDSRSRLKTCLRPLINRPIWTTEIVGKLSNIFYHNKNPCAE